MRRLEPGDCFGEIALLGDHIRTASTRSLTSVNLLAVDRDSFHALFSTLPPLRDFFDGLIQQRTMTRGPDDEQPVEASLVSEAT